MSQSISDKADKRTKVEARTKDQSKAVYVASFVRANICFVPVVDVCTNSGQKMAPFFVAYFADATAWRALQAIDIWVIYFFNWVCL